MKKITAKRVFDFETFLVRIHHWIGPGERCGMAQFLDRLAARRVFEAIIAKTNNARTVHWVDGPEMRQYPLAAWVLQEVIASLKPHVIVETGTYVGGSAYFFACICDLLKQGEVISIDIAPQGAFQHPRIKYLRGSSTDPDIVATVAKRIEEIQAKTVLIVLDSDHRAQHVQQELDVYAPFVPVGSYIHVQDGCIDELRRFRKGRPGPMVAVKSFLKVHPEFIRDTEIETRYVMASHPYGWLKRIAVR